MMTGISLPIIHGSEPYPISPGFSVILKTLWLHIRGLPGAHVIIKSGGRPVPEEVVRKAASVAAYYSPARDEHQVAVDITERRSVGRVRGGHPGLVTYRNERTIEVKPEAGR